MAIQEKALRMKATPSDGALWERIPDAATLEVGAGIKSTLTTLDISTINTSGLLSIYAEAAGSATGPRIQLGGSALGTPVQEAITFSIDGTEYMRVDGDFAGRIKGNVGIRTSAAAYPLDVSGVTRVGVNGTAAAPALIIGSTETNTGFFNATSDVLGFATAGSERMRLDANGLGIGTSASAVDVVNVLSTADAGRGIKITNSSAGASASAYLGAVNDGGKFGLLRMGSSGFVGVAVTSRAVLDTDSSSGVSFLTRTAATDFRWYIGGTTVSEEKMRFNSTGLGIFNTSPSYPLDVTGVARVNANGTAAAPALIVGSSETNTGLFNTGADILGFATVGLERMRISATQVLITGNAGSQLDVYDSVVNSRIVTKVVSGSNPTIYNSYDGGLNAGNGGALSLQAGPTGGGTIAMYGWGRSDALAGDIGVYTGTAANVYTQRMYFDAATGYVTVGASAPTHSFSVTSGSSGIAIDATLQSVGSTFGSGGESRFYAEGPGSSTGPYLRMGGSSRGDSDRNATIFLVSNTEYGRFDGSNGRTLGNFGIGNFSATAVPTKFAVQADGSASTVVISMGATSDGNTGFFHPAADQIGYAAGGSEIARMTTTGLGIFNTSPSYPLDVTGVVRVNTDGTAAAPAVIVGSSETNTGLFNAGSDVLGIATAGVERVRWSSTAATGVVFNNGLADYDFRVNGDTIADVLVVDASIDTVLVRGYRLGRAGSSTSDTNTAFGLSALGSASGTDNTAFGSNALLAAGAATGNTAFGANALDSVSTGGANTAVGANAGTAFTTASDSTAVGSGALPLSTQGQMTAVGSGALSTVSTGLRCTAVGYNALAALDTNSDSTAVGHQAGANATGGSGTFVGANAGNGVTSGTQCTALGQGALTTATFTGSNVTCLGYNAEPSTSSVSDEITLGDANVTTLRCATTSITAISDARDKTEIRDLELGLDFIEKLRPRRFRWNKRDLKRGTPAERPAKLGPEEAGFIAQELDAAQTEASADWVGLVLKNNPERLEASQGKLIPILVKALQELSEQAKALTVRIAQLEAAAAA